MFFQKLKRFEKVTFGDFPARCKNNEVIDISDAASLARIHLFIEVIKEQIAQQRR